MTLINPSAVAVLDVERFPTGNLPAATLPLSGQELMVLMQNGSNGYLAISNLDGLFSTLPAAITISAGTQSSGLTGLTFVNSPTVSFGLNNGVLTASASGGGGGGAITFSAGGSSGSLNSLVFSDANGLAWGLNGSTLTGSYTVPGATVFSNSNNVTFGLVGSTITATFSQTVQTQSLIRAISGGASSVGGGTVVFSNSNNVSFGLNGSTMTATVTVATSLTNINVSAGTTSNNLSALTFSNAGNVSFGLNGSVITATATVATSLTNFRISAGTTSNLLSALTFANGGGVSFGLNASTLTASIATSLTNINVSAGTTSQNLSALTFSNSNGISFGLNGSVITGSHNGITSQSNQQLTMFATGNTTQSSTGTSNASSLIFNGAGNVSVGISNGSIVISGASAAPSPVNFSAGTTSGNLGSVVFSNSNGVTFGLNGSTITASVNAGGGGPMSLYALGNTTQNSSTTLNSLSFNALGGMTWGYSNGSIQVSAPAVSSLSATGIVSISTNGNTISIGAQVSSTILSAYEPYPIGLYQTGSQVVSYAPSNTVFNRVILPANVAMSNANLVLSFNVGPPTATSTASTGAARYSYAYTMYVFTRQNFSASSTRMSYLTSGSFGLTAGVSYSSTSQSFVMSWVTDSTGGTTSFNTTSSNAAWSNFMTGRKIVPVPLVTTLTAGEYFIGFGHSSTTGTTQQNTTLLSVSHFAIGGQQTTATIGRFGSSGSNAALNFNGFGHGQVSAITTNNTMAMSVASFNTLGALYFNLSNATST